jgi:hypothetical protein
MPVFTWGTTVNLHLAKHLLQLDEVLDEVAAGFVAQPPVPVPV